METEKIEVEKKILAEFQHPKILFGHFGNLLKKGLFLNEIHPVFLSYLTVLGNRLGYIALVDLPVTDEEKRNILSESKQTAKHPDSIWMSRNTLKNLVFFEFEGCQKKEQLEQKAKNLVRCLYHAQEEPSLLILIYWLKTSEGRTFVQKAREILEFGFKESGYVFSPPQKAFIIKADFKFTDERAFFKKFVIL